jgi:hypothetical protein
MVRTAVSYHPYRSLFVQSKVLLPQPLGQDPTSPRSRGIAAERRQLVRIREEPRPCLVVVSFALLKLGGKHTNDTKRHALPGETDGNFEAAGSSCKFSSTTNSSHAFFDLPTSTDEYVDLFLGFPPSWDSMWCVGAIIKRGPCAQDVDSDRIMLRARYYLLRRR